MSSSTGARWKQWVLSWLVVLPLTVSMPWGLATLLELVDLEWPGWLFKVVVAGLISFNMVYWMLPLSARLLSRWMLR